MTPLAPRILASVPEPAQLLRRIRRGFRLDWWGIHGSPHWARVAHHGRTLAGLLGMDPEVPTLFALLHDSQRHDDGSDPDHGPRAARFVEALQSEGVLALEPQSLDWLVQACEGHSLGTRRAPLPVQICWDADRLDLGRVDEYPDWRRLCTKPARDTDYIEFAWRWARQEASARRARGTRRSGPEAATVHSS